MNEQFFNFKIPGFDVIEYIGSGGMGQVFLVKEKSPSAFPRAVKILNPHPFAEYTDIKFAEDRFKREAQSISQLKHISIVSYITSGFTDDSLHRPYIVMEYIKGKSMIDYALQIDFPEKVNLFVSVLNAMDYAHSMGVLHRDLKPSNIIVRESDINPVIVDFGFSYIFELLDVKTLTLHPLGTPGYIPQEVILNPRERSVAHDIYSSGIILYQILAGNIPNIQRYSPLTYISNDLVGLDRIVNKAIAPIETRYKTMKEFLEDISDWQKILQEKRSISPIVTEFKSRLIEKKRQIEEQRQERDKLERRKMEALQDAHSKVYPALAAAFRQVFLDLKEVYGNYEFLAKADDRFPDISKGQVLLFTIRTNDEKHQVNVYANSFVLRNVNVTGGKPIVSGILKVPLGWEIISENLLRSPKQLHLGKIVTLYSIHAEKVDYSFLGITEGQLGANHSTKLNNTAQEVQRFIISILEKYFELYG